jgi:hypothetical protein
MVKRLIISNIDDLNPAMADYGVILSETHPEVVFKRGRQRSVDGYLWYNFKLEEQPSTFTSYYAEKLAIVDSSIALMGINNWNQEILFSAMDVKRFDRILCIGKKRFGIIHTENPHKSIVMMNTNVRYPWQVTINAGRGGYPWTYLNSRRKPTDLELKGHFNLNKYRRERFKDLW